MTLITGIIGFNCCHSTITEGFTRKKKKTKKPLPKWSAKKPPQFLSGSALLSDIFDK